MFITFYDKDFRPLADNSSLNVESYSLKRRAYDLNEFSCVCEPVEIEAEPMFAVLKDNRGASYYDMLNPIIEKNNENKSVVTARDLKALFNTNIVFAPPAVTLTSAQAAFEEVFAQWKSFLGSGFATVSLDVSDLAGIALKEFSLPAEKDVRCVKDLFANLLGYYDLYMTSKIDLAQKKLTFVVGRTYVQRKLLKLEDFGISDFDKVAADVNVAVAMTSDYSQRKNWYLTSKNQITDNAALQDIFPVKAEIYTNDDLTQANYDAIAALADNRFQEGIEVNTAEIAGDFFDDADFGTTYEIYTKKGKYKDLPIGEISETDPDNRVIRIGYKPISFIQMI